MSMLITDECIECGVCEPECPNGAIMYGDARFFVRRGLCTECFGVHDEPQCRMLCPVDGAVIRDPENPENDEQLARKVKSIRVKQAFLDFDRAQREGLGSK